MGRARDWWPLAALTLAAALLRAATIDVQSYWFDEALTAHLLELPFDQMIAEVVDSELTPPLYYVIGWAWAQVFGAGDLELRSLSLIFGVLTVPAAYLAGRQLASPRVGLVVAALTAFNPLLIWYSQEARPYSLWVLLGTLSVWLWGRAQEDRSRRTLVLWALVAILALLTHYYAAFLIVPMGLWLAWIWRPRVDALVALGAIGAVGVALIPLAMHQKDLIGTGYITATGLPRRFFGLPEDFLTGFVVAFNEPVEQLLTAVCGVVALVAVAWALLRARGDERRGALVAGALAAAAVGLPLILALGGLDYLYTRNMLIAWFPALLVVAVGLAAGRRAGLAGLIVLCVAGVVATAVVARDGQYQRSDWRSLSEALGRADDLRVVAVPPVDGVVSLTIYRDMTALPPGGVLVRDLWVGGAYNERMRAWRPPPGPPRGFELVAQRDDAEVMVRHYRAPRPVRVTAAGLAEQLPGTTPLLEGPGADGPSPLGY